MSDIAAGLDEIRVHIDAAAVVPMTAGPRQVVEGDAPRMLAALDAVLALCDRSAVDPDAVRTAIRQALAPPQHRCLIPQEHRMSRCWCKVTTHRPRPVAARLDAGNRLTWERDVTGGWWAVLCDLAGRFTESGSGPDKAAALGHLAERLELRELGAPGD